MGHKHHIFRNYRQEQSLTQRRVIFSAVFVLILSLILMSRLFYLQVVEHQRYVTKADDNRVMLVTEPPPRGLIYDRHGVVLADNRPIHSLTITPERVSNLPKLKGMLSGILNISEDEWRTFDQRRKEYRRPYQSITLKSQLTDEEWAKVSVDLYKLDGVQVEAQLTRYYPYGEAFAHAIGYVGRITEKDLKRVDNQSYQGAQFIGKTGVEGFYENELFGRPGISKVEVNARGRIMEELERQNPVPGHDLHLYLDARLQQYAYDLLGDYKGSVVALDPNTGGILALVSKPGFDPNLFVRGISSKNYASLRDSKRLPLFNRALRGGYPPASTIKPFMALAGLEYGFSSWNESYYAKGFYQINPNGRRYRDWKREGHGWINLERSIIESVDTYYYQLAHKMGITPIHNFLSQFGFGDRTVLDLNGAGKGLLPSNEWKKAKYKESWYPGDSVNVGIGQGFMVATPIQIATAVTALANRGHYYSPRMVETVEQEPIDFGVAGEDHKIKLKNNKNWERMVNAMRKVVTDSKGTARRLRGTDYSIAGKTGTGQVFSLQEDEEYDAKNLVKRLHDHALFIGFAPSDKPDIVVFSIFENGGSSSKPADLTKQLFDAYLNDDYPKQYDFLKGDQS
ncbi:penicillin-binding protein 2 [Marinomonas mediterranea]|uniref:Peptidoglycan D,D-transpeptidase MrdA n=1 Tax=Marinomonas mediterranea (strain ATCC 700492 / JCM 21426 / NBRC 103028 / MMB-1) TaxID=717774 RepID=F2JY06_MARM1|nr:penicillin-binding protein 2 [Marinomonas mediterranea]ADZ90742.1 penicillin-binding protein 2 [Marinomonas mediterranea MMB-1]WCN08785.1 penicillin-binding protein 2 [Marinomonas mediterranea]WCN16897.1 penicillin-binding protein 2 [Marinomonas mediterranea MMB-1]